MKTKLSGTFTATNPVDNRHYNFDLSKMGWISTKGTFNFYTAYPLYARRKAVQLYLSHLKFIKAIAGV